MYIYYCSFCRCW